MNEKNGIGESKPKQDRRQGESVPELPVGRAYAVEPLAVGKVLTVWLVRVFEKKDRKISNIVIALVIFVIFMTYIYITIYAYY